MSKSLYMRRDWDVIREILIAFEQDRFIEYANSVTLSANEIILLKKQKIGSFIELNPGGKLCGQCG